VVARNISASAARKPSVRRQESLAAKVDGILAKRDRLIGELRFLRDRGESSKFVDNAQQLLTRWWSRSSWSAREELLKSAEWLLRLEKNREGQGAR
jgi:hypothetical protein